MTATALGLLALAVRLRGLGDKPFWLDEMTTVHRASLPFAAMVRDSLHGHHSPLYFALLSALAPHATAEIGLRWPSALFGALSCVLAFTIARRLGGLAAGVAAALVLALSPIQVQYAQEARSYTLVLCAILGALFGLLQIARHPPGSRGAWWCYGLCTCLALNTLGVALLWLACGIAGCAIVDRQVPVAERPAFRRRVASVHALILAGTAPFAWLVLHANHGDMKSALDWVPPLTPQHVLITLQGVYLDRLTSLIAFRTFPAGIPALGIAITALAAYGLVRCWRAGGASPILLVSIVMMPLVLLLVSLRSPMWMPRYLLWSAGPFAVAAGLGAATLPRRLRWPCVAMLGLAGLLNIAPYYRAETKPLWRDAQRQLAAQWHDGDFLLTDDPAVVFMLDVYASPQVEPHVRFTRPNWGTDLDEARAALQRGATVWAVHGRVGQADRTELSDFQQEIAPLGTPVAVLPIGIDITAFAFRLS